MTDTAHSTPKVSVIIPVYNAEKTISRTVDSVLNQTLKDIEVILVNDGSTDNTAQKLQEIEDHDSRVRIKHQDNSGPGAARYTGLKSAKGKYICFCDAGDNIPPYAYQEMSNTMQSNHSDLLIGGFLEVGPNGKNVFRKPPTANNKDELIRLLLTGRYHAGLCSKMFAKGLVNRQPSLMETKEFYQEDLLCMIKILTNKDVVNIISYDLKPIYIYQLDENSVSSNFHKHVESSIRSIKSIIEIFNNKNLSNSFSKEINTIVSNNIFAQVTRTKRPLLEIKASFIIKPFDLLKNELSPIKKWVLLFALSGNLGLYATRKLYDRIKL